MLSVTLRKDFFLVHLGKHLFFSQRVFSLQLDSSYMAKVDFFFFYVLKVLHMFGLVSLRSGLKVTVEL